MPLPGSVMVRKILSFRACTTFPPHSLSSNLNFMSACVCAREHVRECLRECECVSVCCAFLCLRIIRYTTDPGVWRTTHARYSAYPFACLIPRAAYMLSVLAVSSDECHMRTCRPFQLETASGCARNNSACVQSASEARGWDCCGDKEEVDRSPPIVLSLSE